MLCPPLLATLRTPRLRAYLESAGTSASTSYDSPLRRALLRKRRRQEMEGCINGEAIGRLPPSPLPPDDEMLVLFTPDVSKLLGQPVGAIAPAADGSQVPSAAASGGGGGKPPLVSFPPGLDLRCARARVSRCGRTMLTRCDPLLMRPHSPQHQSQYVDLAIPTGLAMRHPLLHSAQLASMPWAAMLDLDLLPEGIADKAALRAQRERRLNSDRLNAVLLRQTQQQLHQQAVGGMMGTASVAGAAAAAAAATAAAAAAAVPAVPTALGSAQLSPQGGVAIGGSTVATTTPASRPPPPPAVPTQGAPAGTLPHVAQGAAPIGTLQHFPAQGTAPPPAAAAQLPLPPQPAAVVLPSGAAVAGSTALQAPGSSGGQARKMPKVGTGGSTAPPATAGAATPSASASGAAGAAAARSPPPGGASLGSKQGVGLLCAYAWVIPPQDCGALSSSL